MKFLILTLLILLTTQVLSKDTIEMILPISTDYIEGEADVEEIIAGEGSYTVVSANLTTSFFETDPYGHRILLFGAQWVISQLIGYNLIPNDPTWKVNRVISGELVAEYASVDYTIETEFINDKGKTFIDNMVVSAFEYEDAWEVKDHNYLPSPVSIESEYSGEEFQNEEEFIVGIDNESEGGEFLIEEESLMEGWHYIPIEEALNDPHILELVNQGAEYAFNKAFQEGTIPSSDWTLTSLDSVSFQNLEKGTYYYFTAFFDFVRLRDHQAMQAQAGYFVFEDVNNSSSVVSSGFFYLGINVT